MRVRVLTPLPRRAPPTRHGAGKDRKPFENLKNPLLGYNVVIIGLNGYILKELLITAYNEGMYKSVCAEVNYAPTPNATRMASTPSTPSTQHTLYTEQRVRASQWSWFRSPSPHVRRTPKRGPAARAAKQTKSA